MTDSLFVAASASGYCTLWCIMKIKWQLSISLILCTLASTCGLAQQTQDASPPDSQTSGVQRPIHSGGKDDVNSIGTRKLGGRGFGNWYSLEAEISLGKEYADAIEASVRLLSDPITNEYVNRVGQNLVRNSDAKVPFNIKVIDSDEMNAFSLPGGFMYINSGAILAARDEAEFAGIMAHEIAHVAARHATRQMTRSRLITFASLPLIFAGGAVGFAAQQAFLIGSPLTRMKFSRGFELEADHLGVQYLYKAGYDPQSFVSFFERIEAHKNKKSATLTKLLSTHPQTSDRLKKIQNEISTILPPRELYIVTTSEFDDIQARLHSLHNRRIMNQRESATPALRRPTATEEEVGPQSDDECPTLERRDK